MILVLLLYYENEDALFIVSLNYHFIYLHAFNESLGQHLGLFYLSQYLRGPQSYGVSHLKLIS